MRKTRHTLSAVAIFGASLVLPIGGDPGATASTVTRVSYVAPVSSGGLPLGKRVSREVHGKCEPGSDSVPGPVYRCFAGNSILDPCWADRLRSGSVLCMQDPWADSVVGLDTGAGLPASSDPVPTSTAFPWGVRLANGEKCLAEQGAHDLFRGRAVDYGCGHRFHLVLLRGMHSSREPWSFDSAIWTGTKYRTGPRETVTTAWYGGPAPHR